MAETEDISAGWRATVRFEPGRIVIDLETDPTLTAIDPKKHGGEVMADGAVGVEAFGPGARVIMAQERLNETQVFEALLREGEWRTPAEIRWTPGIQAFHGQQRGEAPRRAPVNSLTSQDKPTTYDCFSAV